MGCEVKLIQTSDEFRPTFEQSVQKLITKGLRIPR